MLSFDDIFSDLDGHKAIYDVCKAKPSKRYPENHQNSPSKTAAEVIGRSGLGAFESDVVAGNLITTKMTNNHHEANVELARSVS